MTTASMEAAEKKRRIIFFFILGAAALLRLYIVTLDMNILLDQGLVQDDAFYYYVIARHITEHGLSSFDGINLTNGYHPLWQAIALPVFYWLDGDTAVRAMLAIASFFDLLSLIIFYNILSRVIKNHNIALMGVAVLAFHGTIIRTWFNGLETALSIFSLMWLLSHFLSIQGLKPTSLKNHLWLGLIAAISFLSRTDNAIIIIPLFLFLYLPRALSRREWKQGFAASSMLVAVISPWLAWNVFNFGSIVQISGQIRDNTWLTNGVPAELPLQQQLVYGIMASLTPIKIVAEKMFSPTMLPILSGYIYLLVFLLAIFYAQFKYPAFRKNMYLFSPFFIGVTVLFLYHAGVRHFVRGWYNASVLLMLTLLLCLLLDEIKIKYFTVHHRIVFCIFIVALITLYSPYRYTKQPDELRLDDRVAIAEWINLNTPANAIVGAANAGIMGYYANRTVINLDGVVNESAFHARISDQLQKYIHDSHINYLADHKGSITHLCNPNLYYNCVAAENLGRSTQVMRISR